MKSGQTIDASFVSAPVQRNTREENTVIKEGAVPLEWPLLIRPAASPHPKQRIYRSALKFAERDIKFSQRNDKGRLAHSLLLGFGVCLVILISAPAPVQAQSDVIDVIIVPQPPPPPDPKRQFNRLSNALWIASGMNTAAAAAMGGIGIVAPPALIGAAVAGFAAGVTAIGAGAAGFIAADPPDPNFTIIAQPIIPELSPLTADNDVPQVVADVSNIFMDNWEQTIGYAQALLSSLERAEGAALAGDTFWIAKQLQAATQYESSLATLVNAQPTLLVNLQNTLRAAGFPTITITPNDVLNVQQNIARNGLPAIIVQRLSQLGADKARISIVRQQILAQEPKAIAGKFPDMLTDSRLISALQQLARSLHVMTADLSVTSTASPNPVAFETNLTYTLTVTNKGPDAATGVTLTDMLPAGVIFVSATHSQGTFTGPINGVLTFSLGNLASSTPGNTARVAITVALTPTAERSTINIAKVQGNGTDSNTKNNMTTLKVRYKRIRSLTEINRPGAGGTPPAEQPEVPPAPPEILKAEAALNSPEQATTPTPEPLGNLAQGVLQRLGTVAGASMQPATPTAPRRPRGTAIVWALYQNETRLGSAADGTAGLKVGVGDPEKVAFDVGVNILSLGVHERFAERGSFNFGLRHAFPSDFEVAVGVQNTLIWGGSDAPTTGYGMVTKMFCLKESDHKPFSRLYLSVGVNGAWVGGGSSSIRASAQSVIDRYGAINPFGRAMITIAEPVNVFAEWTGQDLNVGVVAIPFRRFPVMFIPMVADLASHAGNRPRFLLAVGYPFSF